MDEYGVLLPLIIALCLVTYGWTQSLAPGPFCEVERQQLLKNLSNYGVCNLGWRETVSH